MNTQIRIATISDLKEIQALNHRLFKKEYAEYDKTLNLEWTLGEPGTKYYTKRILEDDGFVVVALAGDEIVGYLCGTLLKEKTYRTIKNMAELENMFVLEEYRSKGVGKRLYERFLEWCREKGSEKIRVEAAFENKRAIKFYKDNGFEEHSLVLERDV